MSVEIIEAEKEEPRPEALAKEAVDAIELRDKSEPSETSGWSEKVKEFLKDDFLNRDKNIADAKAVGYFSLALVKNSVRGIFEFAGAAIKKKGDIGFAEGYRIGKRIFDFDDPKKKEK
jgi:hypothetical protein